MDHDNDLDDVTPADTAAANKHPHMGSSVGSTKTSPFSAQGKMRGDNPPHPHVAAVAGKIASQTGHPNKFGTGDK